MDSNLTRCQCRFKAKPGTTFQVVTEDNPPKRTDRDRVRFPGAQSTISGRKPVTPPGRNYLVNSAWSCSNVPLSRAWRIRTIRLL